MLHGLSASLVVQTVKNPPVMWETWVQSLGWGDPLEEGMATHSSILAWRISWLQSPSTVILELKETKSVTASTFPPFICHEVMGPDATILVF